MKVKYPARVCTSNWETNRINGGVSGVGSWRVYFKVDGVEFDTCISGFEPYVRKADLERNSTRFSDNWTGATVGNYSHECELTREQVVELLASIFEWEEGKPLNPYRFCYRPNNKEAVAAYARLTNKDINLFVRGYLYPLPHPHYPNNPTDYIEKRNQVLACFGMKP